MRQFKTSTVIPVRSGIMGVFHPQVFREVDICRLIDLIKFLKKLILVYFFFEAVKTVRELRIKGQCKSEYV